MNFYKSCITFILLFLISAQALGAGHFTATLKPTNAGTSSIVTLIITNDGDQPVSIYKRAIPITLRSGSHLPGDFYSITEVGANGERKVEYLGNWVHPIKLNDSQFITVLPGKKITTSYDLSSDYPIEPGKTYHVYYDAYINAVPVNIDGKPVATNLTFSTQEKLTSNILNITPSKVVKNNNIRPSASVTYPPVTDSNHLTILSQAFNEADSIAEGVAYHYDIAAKPSPAYNNEYSITGNDYTYWFATYNNGDANDQLVAGTVDAIANRMTGHYNSGTPTHPIAFQEGDEDCDDGSTAAVAQTASIAQNGTYLIAICPLFYTLPGVPTTTSSASQPATLIHEFSHFSDLPTDVRSAPEVFYGSGQPWMHVTGDYGYDSYTLSGAHSLSISDRATAVKNASNYEFYFANTPEHE